MEYAISGKNVAVLKTDCLILPMDEKTTLLPADLPADSVSQIKQLIKDGDFTGKRNKTFLITQPAGLAAKRLLLVGSGELPLSSGAFLKLVSSAVQAVKSTGSRSAAWSLGDNLMSEQDSLWQVREGTRAVDESLYQFDEHRSKPKPASALNSFTFVAGGSKTGLQEALRQGQAIAAGVTLCRDLGNRPPNFCYPVHLTEQAKALAKQYPQLKVSVISEAQAEKLGMGAFCAVARGSEREGQIIVMEYKGAKGAPVALVGKGVTFDTGGISLKPGAGMDEMKYDMGGAASVLGTVKTVCELALPIHLVAVIAAAENMPDGRASRPGDIVTTLSGQTVEILNTDAEGRLVLCDALTWVQKKHKPHTVIDIATLTGACVVALGSHAQAIYSNDDELGKALLDAGNKTMDRGWPMPLWEDYQEQLDSPFADMANIGGPKAGSVTAACFLARFTKEVKWAHLDIAGTAWVSGGMQKGATGRPVPLLTRYLIDLAGA